MSRSSSNSTAPHAGAFSFLEPCKQLTGPQQTRPTGSTTPPAPHCRAAGTSPNTQQRCPEGAQLWGTYQQAGDPPHFTWLRKRFATYFLGHASRITC